MDRTDTDRVPGQAAAWKPLARTIPVDELSDWRYVGAVRRGARIIRQYKHREGRRCLNLDERGNAWRISYTPDCTVPDVDPIPLDVALAWARSCS